MTKDDVLAILKPTKTEVKKIPLPGGGAVYVRRMGMDEKDRWENALEGKDGKRNLQDWRAKFLVFALCNEEGTRLFGDDDWAQLKGGVNVLGALVFDEAWAWNGCDQAHLDELKKSSAAAEKNGSATSSASRKRSSTPTT